MAEKITLALFAAIIAVWLREMLAWVWRESHRKKLVHLCAQHLEQIEHTITFFHHYKVNMRTIQTRLKSNDKASLTETSYRNLMGYLRDAIAELHGL